MIFFGFLLHREQQQEMDTSYAYETTQNKGRLTLLRFLPIPCNKLQGTATFYYQVKSGSAIIQ